MESTKTTSTQKAIKVNGEAKKIAIISYITLIGLVIAMVMNNEKRLDFASYHIRQSLGLILTSLAVYIVGVIPILGWIISIFGTFVLLYMWIMALMNAINEKEMPVPFLGKYYMGWFRTIA